MPLIRYRWMIEYIVYFAVAMMFVFGLMPLLWDGVRNHFLQANGLPTQAKVLVIEDTRSKVNGNPVVDLQLSVRAPGGETYAASLRTAISPVDLPRFQPGMTVDVVVDKENPQRLAIAKRR
jgi:hypothetical protein